MSKNTPEIRVPESHYQPKQKKDIVPRLMFVFTLLVSAGFIVAGIYLSNV
jgi:hypothetical protein